MPARGIGKGVMDALEAVDVGEVDEQLSTGPLFAGLQPEITSNSLWAKLVVAVDERRLTVAAGRSLAAFRDMMVALADAGRRESVSILLGKVLDQSGYLRDLREDRSEESEGRIENLMELVSAAREYESREDEPSLGGFVDRLSLLSDVDKEQGKRDGPRHDDDAALGQGPRVSTVVLAGLEEGLFPHSASRDDEAELEEERRLLLRRHHARAQAAGAHERGAGAASLASISRPSRRASSRRFRLISSKRSCRRCRHRATAPAAAAMVVGGIPRESVWPSFRWRLPCRTPGPRYRQGADAKLFLRGRRPDAGPAPRRARQARPVRPGNGCERRGPRG